MGFWVKVPKALEEDTPMWGAWGWSCPWVLVPKDTGLVLPLGMSPKKHRVKDTGYELPLGDVPE